MLMWLSVHAPLSMHAPPPDRARSRGARGDCGIGRRACRIGGRGRRVVGEPPADIDGVRARLPFDPRAASDDDSADATLCRARTVPTPTSRARSSCARVPPARPPPPHSRRRRGRRRHATVPARARADGRAARARVVGARARSVPSQPGQRAWPRLRRRRVCGALLAPAIRSSGIKLGASSSSLSRPSRRAARTRRGPRRRGRRARRRARPRCRATPSAPPRRPPRCRRSTSARRPAGRAAHARRGRARRRAVRASPRCTGAPRTRHATRRAARRVRARGSTRGRVRSGPGRVPSL